MAQKNKAKTDEKTVNFEQILCNLAGIELKNDGVPVTLRFVTVSALMTEEGNISGVEKYGRYALAKKIQAGAKDVTDNEITKIKTLIGQVYQPVVVGPAWEALDAKTTTQAPQEQAMQ